MSTPGYPAYYYGDSQTGSNYNLDHGGGGGGQSQGMRRFASKSSVAGAHSMTGSRSMLYGSRRSLYSTYTQSGVSYVLPIVANQPNPLMKPNDNWPIAFLSIFINPLFGIFALLLSEQSKVYYSKCMYIKASQYGSYAKGTAAGGLYCTCIVLLWVVSAVCWERYRYNY